MEREARALQRLLRVQRCVEGSFAIGQPVGCWKRGAANHASDVETVQLLLEHASHKLRNRKFNPRGIDGKIARAHGQSHTVRAIESYQRACCRVVDSLVEPDASTFDSLKLLAVGENRNTLRGSVAGMKTARATDGMPPWLSAGAVETQLAGISKPVWISVAEEEIGQKEIRGKKNNNERILDYHYSADNSMRKWERIQKDVTDEDPWCASFVNWVLEQSKYQGTDSAWSHSYRNWGQKLAKPALGAVAFIDWGKVNSKKKGKGHVGFVVGRDQRGRIVLLGGNQGNQVKYSGFKESDIASYHLPANYEIDPEIYRLPTMKLKKGGAGFKSTR